MSAVPTRQQQRKMGKNLTKLVYLVNFLFTIVCMLHVTQTLYSTIYPPYPEIKVFEKELKDITFPILFKICGKELRHASRRFNNFGYATESNFYGGISKFSKNNTIVGWNGHTENGSTIGPLTGKYNKIISVSFCCIFFSWQKF